MYALYMVRTMLGLFKSTHRRQRSLASSRVTNGLVRLQTAWKVSPFANVLNLATPFANGPYFHTDYNIYADELSIALDMSGVGCRYLGSINHLCYADDMALLSPTPQGLQKMLDICADYAEKHDIVFNTKKTVCMAFLSSLFKHMTLPDIVLCGNIFAYIDCYKYLGYHISSAFSKLDDLELRYQYRLLCCRANSLVRKFLMCSYAVKKYLYLMYCSNVSSVHLWHWYRVAVLRKFVVCFNNATRMFFGYERFCSASNMFVRWTHW